jgi:hypothetical protein
MARPRTLLDIRFWLKVDKRGPGESARRHRDNVVSHRAHGPSTTLPFPQRGAPRTPLCSRNWQGETDAAVRAFQGAQNLEVDGRVGRETWLKLLA